MWVFLLYQQFTFISNDELLNQIEIKMRKLIKSKKKDLGLFYLSFLVFISNVEPCMVNDKPSRQIRHK